jgi:hypothetical protein
MQKASLLQQAKGKAPAFKRPDISAFIPSGQEDAVARIVAAGMKMMYAPDMKDEVLKAVQADEPVGQKLGSNAAGIVLTLYKQSQQGLPPEAIFPAAAELMSECADMLIAAGQTVTQEDWKEGFFVLVAIVGKQLGGTDEQIMSAMQQAGGSDAEDGADGASEPGGEPAEEQPQQVMA